METEIEDAIKELTKRSHAEKTGSNDALKFTQAALNLAHTQTVLKHNKK